MTRWSVMGTLLAVAMAAGCTMKKQEAPPLAGPSELGTSINVSVTPDILQQDGASQSLVTITARDSNGLPYKNLSLRSEIEVGGVRVDFGSLSARNLVTDSSGRATLVYTAPALPSGPAVDTNTIVSIVVTPLGSDFGNSNKRIATIRLVPVGTVVPADGLSPYFTFAPAAPTDHQVVLFTACSDPATPCAPSTNPITSYSWSFGDGQTASGNPASHSFNAAGTYVVTLTVTDQYGRSATSTQAIDVGGGTAPTASFLTSPSTPRVAEHVNFNASASTAGTGRTIRSYDWDFGDGEQKRTTTPITTHDFQTAGDFTVTLVVTDDAGRTGVTSNTITVATDAPIADFTFTQLPPTTAHTMQFNSAPSSVVSGRTIASYFWDFGDPASGALNNSSQASPSHVYPGISSPTVTLTITDSAGKVGRVTKTVSVQ